MNRQKAKSLEQRAGKKISSWLSALSSPLTSRVYLCSSLANFLSQINFRFFALALLLALFQADAIARVTVTTVDGDPISGELLTWNTKSIAISHEGTSKTFNLDQLLDIRWLRAGNVAKTPAALIELNDGTRLPISKYEVTDFQATVSTSLSKNPLQIATNNIRRVQFTPSTDQLALLWKELEDKQLAGDVLIVHKKQGTILDYLPGLLGDITAEQVLFEWEGDEIPVKRSKIAALAYFHATESKNEPATCWLKTNNGARLPIVSTVVEGANLRVVTVDGLEFILSQDSLSEADFSQGKLRYLSDLEPIKQTWTPRIALPLAAKLIQNHGLPRRDQSFTGSALTLDWGSEKSRNLNNTQTYEKGLAIRSRTEILYRLPKQMQRFVAVAGIDPATANHGSVLLEISADGRVVWQGEIAGRSQPTEISVPLDGARQLRIFVDYGANLDYGDRLHLIDARVTK